MSVFTKLDFTTIGYKIDIDSYDIGISFHTLENKIDIIGFEKIDSSYSTLALSLDKKYFLSNSSNKLFYGIAFGENDNMKYLDYKFGIEYNINDNMEISLGYKVKEIEIDGDNYDTNLSIKSLYIKFLKRF